MPEGIVLISGVPGSGKTSVSQVLAGESSGSLTVHMHTDDFYQYIRKGYISPWLDGSGDQNETMVEAVAASAKVFSAGGYEVYVDGMIGPWFLDPWLEMAKEGVDVRYVILRPGEAETVLRATSREQRAYFPLNAEIVSTLWHSLDDLGAYASHAVDTTGQSVKESAALLQRMLREGRFRI